MYASAKVKQVKLQLAMFCGKDVGMVWGLVFVVGCWGLGAQQYYVSDSRHVRRGKTLRFAHRRQTQHQSLSSTSMDYKANRWTAHGPTYSPTQLSVI
jgi:hypothetical protein